MYTPRTSSYIENAWPLLRDFGYSREEIAQVVRECEYDEQAINEKIAELALDGAEGKGWKKTHQPKPAKTAANRKSRNGPPQQQQQQKRFGEDNRREGGDRREGERRQAGRTKPYLLKNEGRPAEVAQRPPRKLSNQQQQHTQSEEQQPQQQQQQQQQQPQRETVGTETQNRRAGTWASRLKTNVKKAEAPTTAAAEPQVASQRPESSPKQQQSTPPVKPAAKPTNTWANRVRGIKAPEPQEEPAKSPEAAPEVSPMDVAPTNPVADKDLYTQHTSSHAEPTKIDSPAQAEPEKVAPATIMPPRVSPPAPVPQPVTSISGSDHFVIPTSDVSSVARAAPDQSQSQQQLPRSYDQYAHPPPPYTYQQHPYLATAYRMPSYFDMDYNRLRVAAQAQAQNFPEYYVGYPPRLQTSGAAPAEDQRMAYDGAGEVAGAAYPYYYAPYEQRRFEYISQDTPNPQQPPQATGATSGAGREYRDYSRAMGEQYNGQLPPGQQGVAPSYPRPDTFRRDAAYYGMPPVYMTMAQQEQPSAAAPTTANTTQYAHQQYPHFPYNGAGYYAPYSNAERRSSRF